MPVDHIRYDILAQEALRGLVRKVLADAAKNGLPGEHHFFVTFDTTADGVRLSPRLREQYPEEMTVVLQHQFWDLKVGDESMEVGLSFGGVPEKLFIPLDAITGFADPSVQFALQFQAIAEAEEEAEPSPAPAKAGKPVEPAAQTKPKRLPAAARSVPAVPEKIRPEPVTGDGDPPDKSGGAVVRLDRFRKK